MTDDVPRDAVRDALTPFFERNTSCEYQSSPKGRTIEKPWGDDTFRLRLADEPDELVAALNSVYLPARFTALWHVDTRDIEFIFSVLPLTSELHARSFAFQFRGHTYRCEYGRSSERLLTIAEHSVPSRPPTTTNHRNLAEFSLRRHAAREHPEDPDLTGREPTSFWIRNVEWDESLLVDVTRHLNFYMLYFDEHSPRVAIHETDAAEGRRLTHNAMRFGPFPQVVAAQSLDPYFLILWEGTVDATDVFLQFVHSYQILEYAAFYYLEEETANILRRILEAPETSSRLTQSVRQILDVMTAMRMDDEAKLSSVIKQSVDPAILWHGVIGPNPDVFSTEVRCDGGFTLPALIKRDWTLEDFKSVWYPKIPDALRKVRNALVHSREARQARGIAPTKINTQHLRPWAHLVGTIAEQLIVHSVVR